MPLSHPKRIFLVDDHPLIRRGLRLTLETETDLMVCCEASSTEEAVSYLPELDPDIVMLDVSLPGASGLELLHYMIHNGFHWRVLVVSRHDEMLYAERAIRSGARGYVMKSEAPATIIAAVRTVLSGKLYVSDAMNERLLTGFAAAGLPAIHQSPSDLLSKRELEVFEMTGRGLGTRLISDRLALSIKTVESYRARIKFKLNLTTASELVQHAVQWTESQAER
ncbi:MAG: response regulator transcription factor [Rhodothermales bacterium]